MAAPVIRITGDGAARVTSGSGPVRVAEPGAVQPWTGERRMTIDLDGARTVTDLEGRAVQMLTARVGELTDATVTLREDGAPVGDLSAAVIGWDATSAAGGAISGTATGGAGGAVVLHLEIPDGTPVGVWALTIRVDGVTWPTARRSWLITLTIVEDR